MKKIKNIKKWGSLLLIVVLLLSTMMGCKSNTDQTTDGEPTPKTETTETTETTAVDTELPEVHLVWYTIGTPQTDQAAVNEAMSAITKEKINATIEIRTIDWGSYNDKMNVIMAGGEEFDLCYTSSWTNNYLTAVPKGAFVALDDPNNNLLEKYGQSYLAQVPAAYQEAARINGNVYAVLNYQMFTMTSGLKVKRALADEFGLDPANIKKLTDIEPFLEWVKVNKPDYTPFLHGEGAIQPFNLETGYTMAMATSDWELPFFVKADDPELKVFTYYYNERANAFRNWYEKGYTAKDAGSKDVTAEGASGKYAVREASNIGAYDFKTSGTQDSEYYSIQTAPSYIDTNSIIATMTAISKTSKNPERAMMFLNLMHEDKDLYNLACHGIKDKHYTVEADGGVLAIADAGYNPNTDWLFGNQFNALIRTGVPSDIWEKTIEMNEAAQVSPLLGFIFDTEPVKTEIAQMTADPDGINNAFEYGMLSDVDDHIAEYAESIKKETEIVQAELQKQIDAWIAVNKK